MTNQIPADKPQHDVTWVDALIAPFESKLAGCSLRGLMVRGYYHNFEVKLKDGGRGDYGDAFFWRDLKSGLFVSYNANSDPSVFRTRVATVKANQVCWYRQGLHGLSSGNPYMAFRQTRPITVTRDGSNKDDTGIYYTDLHRGGTWGTSSLGCLTIPPSQWPSCKQTGYDFMNRNAQKEVPVLLVEKAG